jgi:hypothetical protein
MSVVTFLLVSMQGALAAAEELSDQAKVEVAVTKAIVASKSCVPRASVPWRAEPAEAVYYNLEVEPFGDSIGVCATGGSYPTRAYCWRLDPATSALTLDARTIPTNGGLAVDSCSLGYCDPAAKRPADAAGPNLTGLSLDGKTVIGVNDFDTSITIYDAVSKVKLSSFKFSGEAVADGGLGVYALGDVVVLQGDAGDYSSVWTYKNGKPVAGGTTNTSTGSPGTITFTSSNQLIARGILEQAVVKLDDGTLKETKIKRPGSCTAKHLDGMWLGNDGVPKKCLADLDKAIAKKFGMLALKVGDSTYQIQEKSDARQVVVRNAKNKIVKTIDLPICK